MCKLLTDSLLDMPLQILRTQCKLLDNLPVVFIVPVINFLVVLAQNGQWPLILCDFKLYDVWIGTLEL